MTEEQGRPEVAYWSFCCVGPSSPGQKRGNVEDRHSSQEVTLSRDLKLLDITMIGIGGMIGAGIFVLTGIAAGQAGPALVLAFLFNGLVTLLTAMAYAELGSALPVTGGGYSWIKTGLGSTQGFLSGWMDWFAHAVAGTLYALGFGRFATELWHMAGLPDLGLSVESMSLIFMTLIGLAFMALNYWGASEAGKVGNIITGSKVAILGIFVLAGFLAMTRAGDWQERFSASFFPNGAGGVLVAMGLTFIAFEGYEIIAQSGEEVIDPKRNIPRAIFISLGVAVLIYVLVAFVAIGATQVPDGVAMQVWQYLGEKREIAVVEAAGQFLPYGAVILIISALASTMSALNATTYSSSRVAFAMGRDHHLPAIFARIHPKRHTPNWAVVITGGLIILMGWLLPIDEVAAASSIMFLLLFAQVNVTVMVIRRKMPHLDRGFQVPWFPVVPVLGLLAQALLAVYLFTYSPRAWYVAAGWIVAGSLAYYTYFSKIEALEKPRDILLEEVLVGRDYSVLVPVATHEQARILGRIGSVLAHDRGGEVFALYVVRVPPQLTLSDGRHFLREGRPHLETVIQQARQRDVPVHTMIRLGRDVAEAVRHTVMEQASDLIVLGWPGYTNTVGRLFGSVIDPIVDNPPVDIAVVRYRKWRPLRAVLVPVAGGRNSRLAVRAAISMARQGENDTVEVTVMHVVRPGCPEVDRIRADKYIQHAIDSNPYQPVKRLVVEGESVLNAILQTARGYDLIVIGATDEPLLKNLLVGDLATRVANEAEVTVVMIKRRSGAIKSLLRQTVLAPSTLGPQVPPAQGPESDDAV
jgi:amino acid transporter/nucleotide-binding universal stress UspA family protein